MSKRKYSELKVGIFVTVAVIIVIGTIFWAKGFTTGFNHHKLTVYFDNVTGLNEGDPVVVKGVRSGKVNSISLDGDSVKVDFNLEKSIEIRTDYTIMVGMAELMSGKVIYIDPGKNPAEIDYEQPLVGSNTTDISQLLSSFTEITYDVKEIVQQVSRSVDNLDQVIGNVNEIVGDGVIRRDIRSTLSNLEVSSRNLNQFVSENRIALRNITGKVDNTVDNLDIAVSDNSRELQNTLRNVQQLTINIDTLVNNVNLLTEDIKEQRSGLGRFIYDDKFFNNLNQTILEIERLTKSIRRDGVKVNLGLF
jgi:phospholipid/cholesterol/gamma-HCH transport system substrate-binding protein